MTPGKRVCLDGRTFVVILMPDGSPRSIKERKIRAGRIYLASYWHHSKPVGQEWGVVARVLAVAEGRQLPAGLCTSGRPRTVEERARLYRTLRDQGVCRKQASYRVGVSVRTASRYMQLGHADAR